MFCLLIGHSLSDSQSTKVGHCNTLFSKPQAGESVFMWREISESESTKLSIIFGFSFLPPALLNKRLVFEKATHQQVFLQV